MCRRTILVTGADGFIGSHLVEALVRRGDSVRAFIYYTASGAAGTLEDLSPDIRDQFETIAGDVRDMSRVRQAMKGCDLVFHLAALIGVPYSYLSPETYIDTNVKGTLNVLQAARDVGVAKVVHTSTSEVYGSVSELPISETHPVAAKSPYAASKIAADQLVLSFIASFELPAAIVRPFNTFGPRQSTRGVIPTIITQLAGGRQQLRLGALHPTRDFSYVSDVVRGFLAVADSNRTIGEVVNFGTGTEISIREVAETIGRAMGVEVGFEMDTERLRPPHSEVERLAADTTKAHRLLGWTPMFAGRDGFMLGIRETVAWFLDRAGRAPSEVDRYSV